MITIITENGILVDCFKGNGPAAVRVIHYEREAKCEHCGRWVAFDKLTTAIDEKVLCVPCAAIVAAHSNYLKYLASIDALHTEP